MPEASKLRRPPDYPLFAGLVWHKAASGRMRAGDPLAQWAYIFPGHPEGLEASHVPYEAVDVQTELVWTWFCANFEPFPSGAGWPGYGHGGYGTSMGYAPERRPPDAILTEEFYGVAAPAVIVETARMFKEKAPFWVLKPPPLPITEASDEAAVRAALAKLMEAAEAPPEFGHNQGPPLTDHVPVAQIAEGVRQVEVALSASSVEGRWSRTVSLTVKVGQEMLSGALRWAGQEMAKAGIAGGDHYLPTLHRALVDALTAIVRWLSGT